MATQPTKNYDPRLVGALTDQGPTRSGNQDAFWIPDKATPTELGALYVVADGVGGQEHGAEAARMVTAVLSDVFYRARQHGRSIPAALQEAVQQANIAVFEDAERRQARMGSTVVAAVLDNGQVTVAHVGDARAYLALGGALHPLTRDDTWVQKQVDAGIITPDMAEKHEFRNVVTQALGNRDTVQVHLTEPQPFGPGAALLLCSDGLYDALTPEELHSLLAGQSAPVAARALVEAAIAAQATDNITAVVVQSTLPGLVALPPAAKKTGRRSVPLWLGLALVLVVVVVSGGLFVAWRAAQPPSGGGDEAATPVGTVPALFPDEGETAVTPTSPPATTNPTALATAPATAVITSTATPTVTIEPTAAPTPAPPLACVDTPGQLFVWPDEAMQPAGCPNAIANFSLLSGETVLLLSEGAQSLPIPLDCVTVSAFVRIQSVTDEAITGWVFQDQLRLLEPGEACAPP